MNELVVIEMGKSYFKVVAATLTAHNTIKKFFCFADPIASLDDTQLSIIVSATFETLRLKPKNLVVSLPRNLVIMRTLSFPSQNLGEISKMVDLHLVRVVPYKKEEVVYAYSVLDTDGLGYTKVLLSIVSKDALNRQLKILADAGLSADKIALSSCGTKEWILSNCEPEMNSDTVYLGLEVDCDYTEVMAFSKHHLFFTSSIVIGSEQLSENTGKIKLIKEIKQFLAVFRAAYEYKKPEKVIISGAISNLRESRSVFEKELGMPAAFLPVELIINKFRDKQVEIPKTISITSLKEFLFDNPKRIIFDVPEIGVRRELRNETRELVRVGYLLIYIFFITYGLFLGRVYNRQLYLKKLTSSANTIKNDIGDLIEWSRKNELVRSVLEERKLSSLLFQEIYRVLPSRIAVKQMTIDENNKVALRGEAARLSDVFAFISLIEKSERFNSVQTQYTRKKKTREGEFTHFGIEFFFLPRGKI